MAESKRRVYESTTLGVPALKMVLVHAKNEAQNAALHHKPLPTTGDSSDEDITPADKEKVVRRIIERLEMLE